MKISMIGAGYVGLVTGTCLSDSGNTVATVDIDRDRIDRLNRGEIPIYEPGLSDMILRNVREDRLSFSDDLDTAVKNSDLIFIAVGTPQSEDGATNLSYIESASRSIGRALNEDGKIVVVKSTVPVGTCEKVKGFISEETDYVFAIASNPEFLKEGAAIDDFLKPDRVVIGSEDPEVAAVIQDLYSPFVRTGHPILTMDLRSAEMVKYASNAALANRISFINEIATLCDHLGASIENVRQGMGTDSRIGFPFLFPGLGYGGSCFPKDVLSLIRQGEMEGAQPVLLRSVDDVNRAQRQRFLDKIDKQFGGNLSGKQFAIWGLAFKPRTDDVREAPAITIIEELLQKGAAVRAFDPEAIETTRAIIGDRVFYAKNPYEACEGADALIVCTEWNEFRKPDFDHLKRLLNEPVLFDGRNIYRPDRLEAIGFTYHGVGQ